MLNLIILLLLLFVGLGASFISSSLLNIVMISMFAFFGMAKWMSVFKLSFFQKIILEYNLTSKVFEGNLTSKQFWIGPLFWKTSGIQILFYAESNQYKYWFVCGSWFLGSFINKIDIYKISKLNESEVHGPTRLAIIYKDADHHN